MPIETTPESGGSIFWLVACLALFGFAIAALVTAAQLDGSSGSSGGSDTTTTTTTLLRVTGDLESATGLQDGTGQNLASLENGVTTLGHPGLTSVQVPSLLPTDPNPDTALVWNPHTQRVTRAPVGLAVRTLAPPAAMVVTATQLWATWGAGWARQPLDITSLGFTTALGVWTLAAQDLWFITTDTSSYVQALFVGVGSAGTFIETNPEKRSPFIVPDPSGNVALIAGDTGGAIAYRYITTVGQISSNTESVLTNLTMGIAGVGPNRNEFILVQNDTIVETTVRVTDVDGALTVVPTPNPSATVQWLAHGAAGNDLVLRDDSTVEVYLSNDTAASWTLSTANNPLATESALYVGGNQIMCFAADGQYVLFDVGGDAYSDVRALPAPLATAPLDMQFVDGWLVLLFEQAIARTADPTAATPLWTVDLGLGWTEPAVGMAWARAPLSWG